MVAAARVLLVEDDENVREVVRRYLGDGGHEVLEAADGVTGLRTALERAPDVVVLDLMLPGRHGLSVCRELKAQRPDLPVVLLTALGEEHDRVRGLELGADDYVTKPFSPRELTLRVASVLRRAAPAVGSGILVDGDLHLDRGARRAVLAGAPLSLTGREYDLLEYLLLHPGRAFTRPELLAGVWGWEFGDQSTVTVHVRRLREKVERDPTRPRRIATVWGVGYRYDRTASPC
ncbi:MULTISPECIES: response regulator transcription factor [Pseudonocardia]|uniref:response regulator transcription factor n=1 Tax=Pseudonocardia TaxID=1847 RepID=UPI0015C801A6|nr:MULTISPECIES: response regulator transcription factor [Pseudonocardia]MCO7192524.1 response regulator transcription factor [Pseudonocardia sp. McavD-2-B]